MVTLFSLSSALSSTALLYLQQLKHLSLHPPFVSRVPPKVTLLSVSEWWVSYPETLTSRPPTTMVTPTPSNSTDTHPSKSKRSDEPLVRDTWTSGNFEAITSDNVIFRVDDYVLYGARYSTCSDQSSSRNQPC